jgi:DNA-binding IclR family transcriptional regulator
MTMTATGIEAPRSGESQTVARAGLILACFSSEEPHQTLAELAAKLGLNQSTVYRYVAALQTAGLLERDGRRGGYRLGPRVIELSNVALNQSEVRKQALDEMDPLRDRLSMLVSLGVLLEGDVLHIAHAVPAHWPRWYTTVGRRAVAHCTSLGKVLLAARPWPEVRQLVERHGWRPYTPNSIQGFDRLEQELALIREQGYAIDNEERKAGTACLGAPIRDYSGEVVAALSVSGKAGKLSPEFRAEILPHLREAADRISLRLGYHGSSAYL